MGWVLIHNGTRKRLILRPGAVQVGRAQAAQIRPAHQSVSRVHAEIIVERGNHSVSEFIPSSITLVDRSSTGHTFVNGKPSSGKGQPVRLADGDLISFGVDPATFTVRWDALVLSCSSRMSPHETDRMEALARDAGVFLTSEWTDDCTHLLMEQFAITPKLLCCITDGGTPVAASFLDALASCPHAGPPIDPAEHRPRPPVGADAAYAAELNTYLLDPKSRRSLLEGIWVIFGLRQAHDVLSKALLHAGSKVHLLCLSKEQGRKVSQDMDQMLATYGRPKEIWLVPHLGEDSFGCLAPTISSLAVDCFSVPLRGVVGGILHGGLEAVHAAARRVTSLESRKGHLQSNHARPIQNAAQQIVLTPTPAATPSMNLKSLDVKDESFPHTQQQQQQQQQAVEFQSEVQQSCASTKRAIDDFVGNASKRQHCGDKVPSVKESQVGLVKEQPITENLSVEQHHVQASDASQHGMQPCVHGLTRNKNTPINSNSGCLKSKDDAPPDLCDSFGVIEVSSVIPGSNSQPVNVVQEQTPLKLTKHGACVAETAAIKEEKEAKLGPANAIALRFVEHPTGVWLNSLGQQDSSKASDSFIIDGVAVSRAAWSPRIQPHGSCFTTTHVGNNNGTNTVNQGSATAKQPNFKLFKKAQKQHRKPGDNFVVTEPWEPAPGRSLAEMISSQHFDSQSQLPPVEL